MTMTTTKTYLNAIGEEIRLNITDPATGVPTTAGATVTSYKVIRPDGTTTTWNALVYDSNNLTYLTQEGDLSMVGRYKIQAYMEVGSSVKLTGETVQLYVYPLGG
jgi:hypothetical protein